MLTEFSLGRLLNTKPRRVGVKAGSPVKSLLLSMDNGPSMLPIVVISSSAVVVVGDKLSDKFLVGTIISEIYPTGAIGDQLVFRLLQKQAKIFMSKADRYRCEF